VPIGAQDRLAKVKSWLCDDIASERSQVAIVTLGNPKSGAIEGRLPTRLLEVSDRNDLPGHSVWLVETASSSRIERRGWFILSNSDIH
jgi:UDP-N-acetylmuramyl tripeptide synthase